MTERITFTRPLLYPKQLEAIYDPKRYSLIEASTKAGKTSGCICWLIEQALLGKDGQNYWWVAPVSDQANIAFDRMMRALPRGEFLANLSSRVIRLRTGPSIWFKSGDKPDSLFGEDVYAAVVDEASRVKEESWYAIRSTLTFTRGPVRIIGNVKGKKNWFFRMARRAQEGDPDMGFHRLIAYDAIEAGVLDSSEVEDARRTVPEHVFRELYLAQPGDDEGNPFGGTQAIAQCIRPLSDDQPFWWGWDLAKYVDWTVGIGLNQKGEVCRLVRFQAPWGETLARIKRETKYASALIDSTGVGDPIVEELARYNPKYEGYLFTGPSKQKLMEGLAAAIQSHTVYYPDGPIVIELNSFEYTTVGASVRYSAPEGMHDDCVMALALAVMNKARCPPLVDFNGDALARVRRAPDIRRRYA
jgi:hypothetical protein